MLFKTAISALTVAVFPSGANSHLPPDGVEHSTQLKQKDDRELKREQRHSTGLLEKHSQKGPVDDAKDKGDIKSDSDVGILRGKKDRELKKVVFGSENDPTSMKERQLPATKVDVCHWTPTKNPTASPPSDSSTKNPTASPTAPCTTPTCTGASACTGAGGNIGCGSCAGIRACSLKTGNIENGSCIGDLACYMASGNIGSDSCTGYGSCCGVTTDIGDNMCNEDLECCDPIQCNCPTPSPNE